MNPRSASEAPASAESPDTIAAARAPLWRRAIPYLVTLLIFGLIFWRIPIREVAEALKNVPAARFIGLFLPFSLFYFAIDAFCLTWVVRRFNAPVRYAELMPIRASMYLLAMVNTNLGQAASRTTCIARWVSRFSRRSVQCCSSRSPKFTSSFSFRRWACCSTRRKTANWSK